MLGLILISCPMCVGYNYVWLGKQQVCSTKGKQDKNTFLCRTNRVSETL